MLQLKKSVDRLKPTIVDSSLEENLTNAIRDFVRVPETILDRIAQDLILASLHFDEMHKRDGSVHTAHADTFRWFLRDDPYKNLDEGSDEVGDLDTQYRKSHASTGERYIEWLSRGCGIFHLSGKPGCGKSTLMKLICGHSSTKAALGTWAGEYLVPPETLMLTWEPVANRELVTATFFFWKPGSDMQKSLRGLRRSFLHDVLDRCRDWMPTILPGQWKTAKDIPWQSRGSLKMSDDEATSAFNRMIRKKGFFMQYRLCFFIDGLDEHDSTNEDYRDVVDELRRWTEESEGGLKICASSRPLPVFTENLRLGNSRLPDDRINLLDLTAPDMTRFAKAKLEIIADESQRLELARSIVGRAEGIFLWTSIVVKQVRMGHENGKSVRELDKELKSTPKELGELFQHIFDSLDASDQRFVYQALEITAIEKDGEHRLQRTPLVYSFLIEFQRDARFAMQDDFLGEFNGKDSLKDRETSIIKLLRGTSRGLLDVSGRGDVEFAHRSIADFLQTPISTVSEAHEQGLDPDEAFDAHEALVQLNLALSRAVLYWSGRHQVDTTVFETREDSILQIPLPLPALIAHQSDGTENRPFELLECLEKSITEFCQHTAPPELPLCWTKSRTGCACTMFVPTPHITLNLRIRINHIFFETDVASPSRQALGSKSQLQVKFAWMLSAAVRRGYFAWKESGASPLARSPVEQCQLVVLVTEYYIRIATHPNTLAAAMNILDALFKRKVHFFKHESLGFMFNSSTWIIHDSVFDEFRLLGDGRALNTWQCFLINLSLQLGSKLFVSHWMEKLRVDVDNHRGLQVMERYLSCGADANYSFVCERVGQADDSNGRVEFEISFGSADDRLTVSGVDFTGDRLLGGSQKRQYSLGEIVSEKEISSLDLKEGFSKNIKGKHLMYRLFGGSLDMSDEEIEAEDDEVLAQILKALVDEQRNRVLDLISSGPKKRDAGNQPVAGLLTGWFNGDFWKLRGDLGGGLCLFISIGLVFLAIVFGVWAMGSA